MSAKGKLHPDGLPARLVAFFEANPDEELRMVDIIEKFGTSLRNARSAVDTLKARKVIECAHVIRLREKGRA